MDTNARLAITGLVLVGGLIVGVSAPKVHAQDSTTQQAATDTFAQQLNMTQTVNASFDQILTATAEPQNTVNAQLSLALTGTAQPTFSADALDFTKASLFKSDGDILEIKVPTGWQSIPSTGQNGEKIFDFTLGGTGASAQVSLQVQIVDAKTLYAGIDPSGKADSPKTALQSIITANSTPAAGSAAIKFTAVQSVQVGSMAGQGFIADVPASAQDVEFQIDIRIAEAAGGKAIYVVARSNAVVWAKVQSVLNKMISSLVVDTTNIPTSTPAPTMQPLYLTATALQGQINDLQRSLTPVVTAATVATVATITPTAASSATPSAMPTALATAAVDPAGLDFSTARLYKADNDIFEIQLPASWKTMGVINRPDQFIESLYYGSSSAVNAPASIQILIGTPQKVFGISESSPALSVDAQLKALIAQVPTPQPGGAVYHVGNVMPAKLGRLAGYAATIDLAADAKTPAIKAQVLVASLSNGTVAEVVVQSVASMYDKAWPVLSNMVESLLINERNLNLPTPTPADATQSSQILTGTATVVAQIAPASGSVGTPITLADGLQYVDTVIGDGASAVIGKSLTVDYTGKLTNGAVFDTSLGKTPFVFTLGAGQVIKGWEEGFVGMKVGGKRTLTIPPALGYGDAGQGPIPADATLIFDVELLAVK